jgi:hypothetical protein
MACHSRDKGLRISRAYTRANGIRQELKRQRTEFAARYYQLLAYHAIIAPF